MSLVLQELRVKLRKLTQEQAIPGLCDIQYKLGWPY